MFDPSTPFVEFRLRLTLIVLGTVIFNSRSFVSTFVERNGFVVRSPGR